MASKELIKLTPSKIGSFLECPACFWRDYHKKSPPTFPLPGILNRMDSLTKKYYDGYRNDLPPSIKGKIPERLVDAKTAGIVRGYMRYTDEKLNAELRGKMDDCLIDSEGRLVPLDNKTASPLNEGLMNIYNTQLDAYTFLLQKQGFKTADHGYLIYYVADSGDPNTGIIFRAEVKRLEMRPQRIPKLLKEAVEMLRKKKAPRLHKDCEMCEWMREMER